MNEDRNRKLRSYYQSLVRQERFLKTLKGGSLIAFGAIRPLLTEMAMLKEDFPELVPFDPEHDRFEVDEKISFITIMGMLSMVLGRLHTALEESTDVPVTERRSFAFVNDSDLKAIVERDYEEIQRAYISSCWKSTIILCGGAIEAILTDLLMTNKTDALSASSAPRQNDITRWGLSELIDVALELGLVSDGMQKLSHPIREYRNLVHPGNEMRSRLHFGPEEARIAVELLHILHRDLAP